MSDQVILVFLLIVLNGTPIVVRKLLRNRFGFPVDGYKIAWDGKPLFGTSKTIRGVLAASLVGMSVAPVFDIPTEYGLGMGLAAMAGDLISSFIKRRAGIESSGSAPVLDQLPEALLPLLVVRDLFELGWISILLMVVAFIVIDVLISPVLFRMHIRRHPH